MDKLREAINQFETLKQFVAPLQRRAIGELMKGEEGGFFTDKVIEMGKRFEAMPVTHGQAAEEDPIAYLHYFKGRCDFYITEKDMEDEQHQAYGQADIGYGPERGYISLIELQEADVELDLYFEPKRLSEVNKATMNDSENKDDGFSPGM